MSNKDMVVHVCGCRPPLDGYYGFDADDMRPGYRCPDCHQPVRAINISAMQRKLERVEALVPEFRENAGVASLISRDAANAYHKCFDRLTAALENK